MIELLSASRGPHTIRRPGASILAFFGQSLLDLALALNRLDDFEGLFQPPPATSIAELERAEQRPVHKRGRV